MPIQEDHFNVVQRIICTFKIVFFFFLKVLKCIAINGTETGDIDWLKLK